jgi:hypothetical protein
MVDMLLMPLMLMLLMLLQVASSTAQLEGLAGELQQLRQQSRSEASKLAVLQQRRRQLEEQEAEQQLQQQPQPQQQPGPAAAGRAARSCSEAGCQASLADDSLAAFPAPCACCARYQRQLHALQEQVGDLQGQLGASRLEAEEARQGGLAKEAELLLARQRIREGRGRGPDGKPLAMSGEGPVAQSLSPPSFA